MPRRAVIPDPDKCALGKALWEAERRHLFPSRRPPHPVDYDALFSSVTHKPRFTFDRLLDNLSMPRRTALAIFTLAAVKAPDFPDSLYDAYYAAATDPAIVGTTPWEERLYTIEEAAKIFHEATTRAPSSFRAAVRDEELPFFRFGPRLVRLRRADIIEYCESKSRLHV